MTHLIDGNSPQKKPETPLGLFIALSRGKFLPNALWLPPYFRAKFFLRGLIMPLMTYRLLNMITEHPQYEKILSSQPRLPCRIHRPYLSNRLSRKERLKALLWHYSSMSRLLSPENFYQLHTNCGMKISEAEGKDGEIYQLTLISTHKLDREGDATVILKDAAGKMLAEISFTLCIRKGKASLIIGGLQGPNSTDAQARIQKATKSFHGIFPKRIVLEALLHLAALMDVEEVYAVTNHSHVYQSLRYNNRKKHMLSDYDSFWETSGGELINDAFYQLPLVIKRKELEDIPSKKRAEYRRRFSLIDGIRNQISSVFSSQ